ncbi:hypothetical protein CCHR01_04827 [Colletotrichum chrysophilum]|uniref:F-box domain-containing protein n=1 Tax=Colletotrichum chrysophilum TaxID=1836956 RepID=A0AAD9ELC9_9PEZI|nr:hypothetical protein CCHR01_04827 [Colletotrichum chrysophilum]
MLHLLDLPAEILLHVISQFADPDRGRYQSVHDRKICGDNTLDVARLHCDLAAMAALCRTSHTLRDLAEPFLFSFVWLPQPTIRQLLSIMRCWDSRPTRSKYVRRLVCEPISADDYMSEEDAAVVVRSASDMNAELPDGWAQSHNNIDLATEILALRAINVESLELNFRRVGSTLFKCLVPGAGGMSIRPPRFRNLRHLHLLKMPHENFFRDEGIQHILDEAPSLTSLETSGITFNPSRPFKAPNLTTCRLSLDASRPQSNAPEHVVSSISRLVHLEVKTKAFMSTQKAGLILRALRRHASTLQTLSMPIGSQPQDHDALEPLRELVNLTSFEIVLPHPWAEEARSMPHFCLPPSLRTLRLVVTMNHPTEMPIIAEWAMKMRRFGSPELRVLIVSEDFDRKVAIKGYIMTMSKEFDCEEVVKEQSKEFQRRKQANENKDKRQRLGDSDSDDLFHQTAIL